MHNVLFATLEAGALTGGKPFVGFAEGEFVDAYGRDAVIEGDDFPDYLTNTQALIADHKERGMPGLPIDEERHNMGKAAGWIIDAVETSVTDTEGRVRKAIAFVAEWTKLGVELVTEKIMTNFSPNVDLTNKMVEGGTLTNWPASIDGRGVPLFNAIELSRGLHYLQESTDERVRRVRDAFLDEFVARRDVYDDLWPMDVYDDEGYVIVQDGDGYWRVDYADGEDGLAFAARDDWQSVEKQWIEMQRKQRDRTGERPTELASERPDVDDSPATGEGEMDMGEKDKDTPQGTPAPQVNLEKMRDELRSEIRREVIAELAPGGEGEDPEAALARLRESLNLEAFADVADLSQARDAMLKQMQGALKSEYERMQKQAGSMLAEMMQQIKRDQRIAQLAQDWTGGTEQNPRGLPVGREEIETFLMGLPDKQRAAAESILGRIWDGGLTEFSELGHGKKVRGTRKLEPEVKRQLQAHVERGGNVSAFFEAAGPLLGDMQEYDLSDFEEKTNG